MYNDDIDERTIVPNNKEITHQQSPPYDKCEDN